MTDDLPPELAQLLSASDIVEQDQAWGQFITAHNRLILKVAHSMGGGHDRVMDRYAYVVEKLRANDFARLRGYVADGRARFSTWLVVVSRRLCLDHQRRTYGQPTMSLEGAERRATRKRLVELVGEQLDVTGLAGPATDSPEWGHRQQELIRALSEVVENLTSRDRLLLKLRFEFDASGKEIANLLQYPSPFHVYRQLDRVLRDLRRDLALRGIEDAAP